MFRRLLLAVPFCLFCTVGLAADSVKDGASAGKFDWPQWQGPDRVACSKETGLLKQWSKDGPPIAWKAKGLGGGYSTPSIAAGRVYGMGSRKGDEGIWALDEKDGKEIWYTQIVDRKANAGYGEGPRSTPTVDGERLYAVTLGGDLVCVDAARGDILWRKSYTKDFHGRMMSGWGFSESPLVDGDKLICTPGAEDAALVALEKKTGDVIWKAAIPKCGGAGYASIVVGEPGGIRQYITIMGKSGGVVSVDAKSGKLLWSYNRIANGTANIPTPIVRGDYVLCSTGYGAGAALLKLQASPDGGTFKVHEVWFHSGKEMQNHHGGMVLVDDHIFLGNGHNAGEPMCVDFLSGKIAWQQTPTPGSGSAAVLYADGKLYFRYQDGTMALIDAKPSAYKLISKFKLPDASGKPSWPHPVIANGKLYIRDQGTLVCFDVKQK